MDFRLVLLFSLFSLFSFNLVDSQLYSSSEYVEFLNLTTRFYGAQRCGGQSSNWILKSNPAGTNCHTQDGPSYLAGLDLTGGWHDAGDHMKFSRTGVQFPLHKSGMELGFSEGPPPPPGS